MHINKMQTSPSSSKKSSQLSIVHNSLLTLPARNDGLLLASCLSFVLYKWNHTLNSTFVFLVFSQDNDFEIHPCCCVHHSCYCGGAFNCMNIAYFIFLLNYLWPFRLFSVLPIINKSSVHISIQCLCRYMISLLLEKYQDGSYDRCMFNSLGS